MKKSRSFLIVPMVFLTLNIQGQKPRTHAVNANASPCANSPLLAELIKAPAAAIPSSYGYDLHEPWACTKINSPWGIESTLLHFQRVTAQGDDSTAFTVMKVAGISYIWVIPTEVGMLEAPHSENDPHNIAAFNALLGSFSKMPSSAADWNAIGKLYMSMLGHQEVVPVEADTSHQNPCGSDGNCFISLTDRTPHANEPYTKWTLTFSGPSGRVRLKLTDASREVVQRSGN